MDHFSFLFDLFYSPIVGWVFCVLFWGCGGRGGGNNLRIWLVFCLIRDTVFCWESLHLILNFEIERERETKNRRRRGEKEEEREKKIDKKLFEVLKCQKQQQQKQKHGKIRRSHWIRELSWYRFKQSSDKRERIWGDCYGG